MSQQLTCEDIEKHLKALLLTSVANSEKEKLKQKKESLKKQPPRNSLVKYQNEEQHSHEESSTSGQNQNAKRQERNKNKRDRKRKGKSGNDLPTPLGNLKGKGVIC